MSTGTIQNQFLADRTESQSLVVFLQRAGALLLFGCAIIIFQAACLAIGSGNVLAASLGTLFLCGCLIGGSAILAKRWIERHLNMPTRFSDIDFFGTSSLKNETKVETIGAFKALQQVKESVNHSRETLEELQARSEFLQTYVEALHEDERARSFESDSEIRESIQAMQRQLGFLADAVETLMAETAGDLEAPRPTKPR